MIIMAQIAQEVSFEAGHVLFRVGDPGDALYLILEGKVDIVNENDKPSGQCGASRLFR